MSSKEDEPIFREDSLIIPPTSGTHTHTIIFLHGRGGTADNLSFYLHHSPDSNKNSPFQALPTFKWVFPQAPLRLCAGPPHRGAMPQWFDVWNTADFRDNEMLQAEGLKESVPKILEIVAEEAKLLGGKWDRIVLAGISMGAATGVHSLFNLKAPGDGGLGAFVGFSCRCPFEERTLEGMRAALSLEGWEEMGGGNVVLRKTPMLLECCEDDRTVLPKDTEKLSEILVGMGATVEMKKYASGGHWFNSPHGMDDFVKFIEENVIHKQQNETGQVIYHVPDNDDAMDLS